MIWIRREPFAPAGFVLLGVLLAACALTASGDEGSVRSTMTPAADPLSDEPPIDERGDSRGPDIYLMKPRTGRLTSLVADRGSQTNAQFSPNGQQVVYQSGTHGEPSQIFLLKADGTTRQLTQMKQPASDPTWSPDGTQIAFVGTRPGGKGGPSDADIFVIDARGGRIRRLAATPKHDGHPDWSPDGSRIAFQSGGSIWGWSYGRVMVASIPDGPVVELDLRYGGGPYPTWSPDGQWIAYMQLSPGGTSEGWPYAGTWLVRPDGTDEHPLEGRRWVRHWRYGPSWSPSGRSVVFVDGLGAPGRLGIFDVQTNRYRTVLWNAEDAEPSWGPDGILVSRMRGRSSR